MKLLLLMPTGNCLTADVQGLEQTVICLTVDFISMGFEPDSEIPVAAACLQDGFRTCAEARYALLEALIHRSWYHRKNPADEYTVSFYSRFYADDTALRLYSAGEHLATAIAYMLEISDQRLEDYREQKTSQQSIIGHFLRKEMPEHPVTKAVSKLANSKAWKSTMNYRNTWVHDQPPIVEGSGTVYTRAKRWKPTDTGEGHKLEIGNGDQAQYSVVELLDFVLSALNAFSETYALVVQYYTELIGNHGIMLVKENGKSHLQVQHNLAG